MVAIGGVVAALAAAPAVASAQITATNATLEGVKSTSAPSGSVITARVTATVRDATWRATRVRWGSQSSDCIDHDNRSSNGSEDFAVTAPGPPDDYDVTFEPSENSNCSGTPGGAYTLREGLNVPAPATNQDLPPRCGINVMLVLDESGSIGDTPGAEQAVKTATRTFLNSLSGTGAAVSIVDFSTSARQQIGYTQVTGSSPSGGNPGSGTIATVFEPYLEDGYDPNGWTNWEDAFTKVRAANADADQPTADLVVFITDGDPTARNNPPGNPITNIREGDATAMRPAAAQANLVKNQGSHVLAMGVGDAVTTPTSARRLTAVSGFDQYPGTDFSRSDYTLVRDFDSLAAALRAIALELCEASVTVTKEVDEGAGYVPDDGWRFTATVSTSPGGFTWVQPSSGTGASRSATTDANGVVTFQWRPENSGATSTVRITEELQPGYEFVEATCERNGPSGRRRGTILRQDLPVSDLVLRPREYYKCTVRNRIIPGTISIEKSANPEGSQEFPFSGSLGDFTLVDPSAASRSFTGLAPGTYTVRELVPANWALTSIACTPATAVAIAGPQATITLAPGGAVACTYFDTRINPPPPEPPEPPEPPTPVPPVPDIPPEPPPPPAPAPPTVLDVSKTMSRVARVGERVRFRLTVRNVGEVAATNVHVADVPPAALTLSGLQASARPQRGRGYAVWRLGNLAPGARRTIRGSVRVDTGTPGLIRNYVLAAAVNAELVTDRADARLLAQGILGEQESAPPVTG
jgi:uncharacterized repeat protein (TIGR01451 family)